MTKQLSREQIDESNRVIELILAGEDAKLEGRAGTGKTTTGRRILGMLGKYKAVCSAPTNIATDVLRNEYGDMKGIDFSTTASLLKSKKHIDLTNGQVNFIPTKETDHQELLIITDEASMLDEFSVRTLKKTFPNARFLFIGDAGQLPAPNDEDYCVLKVLRGGTLKFNHRCGQGNALFDFIENLYQGDLSLPKEAKDRIEYGDKRNLNIDKLYVTYHNETCSKINDYLLKKHFDDRVQKGVKLISRETFSDANRYKVFNSERMIVNHVEKTVYSTNKFEGPLALIARNHNFVSFVVNNVICGKYKFRFSIDPEFLSFKQMLKDSELWKEYYTLVGMFPDVRLGYSTTTHCVQGITLPEVSMVWSDLIQAPPKIVKPLLYVAASRAQQKVEIIQ